MMDRRRSQQLRHKSLNYHDHRRSSRYMNIGIYQRMFSEDIHLAIMPIGGRSTTNLDFSVSIEPHSNEMEQRIVEALPTRNGLSRYSLTETVCSFVDECAMTMGAYGVAYYEKVNGIRAETVTTPPFQFIRIHNLCIHRKFGIIWQFVPSHVWKEQMKKERSMTSKKSPRRWAFLSNRDVAIFQMPSLIGGPAGFRRILSDLYYIGGLGASQFIIEDMYATAKNRSGYDFAVHRLSQDEQLARVTRRWGWMARNMIRERVTAYYQFHRRLVFEKAKAILREHIISELNRHLADIGKRLGFDVRIIVSGLPSISDCEAAIMGLASGKMQFKNVVEFMRKV